MVYKWLTVFLLATALGCSASSSPKASTASRDLQEQLLVRYAEHYIKQKNFREAMRFVEAIPTDSPHAAKVPEFKKRIEQIIIEHDQAVAERYGKEKTIPIELSVKLNTNQGHEFLVTGKAVLPRYTHLTVSLWREETPNNWELFEEEEAEIGPGSRFQTNLPAHQNNFDKAAIERELTGNFELRVAGCFRGTGDQPEGVMKLVGAKGEKLTGDWIERTDSDGNCVRYKQRYKLQTHFNPPDCVDIKFEKQ